MTRSIVDETHRVTPSVMTVAVARKSHILQLMHVGHINSRTHTHIDLKIVKDLQLKPIATTLNVEQLNCDNDTT